MNEIEDKINSTEEIVSHRMSAERQFILHTVNLCDPTFKRLKKQVQPEQTGLTPPPIPKAERGE